MSRRLRVDPALANLDQMIDSLTQLFTLLPWALRTEDDVDLLFRCFGRGSTARQRWDNLRRLVSPAHADRFILDLIMPVFHQLVTIRDAVTKPPFDTRRDIVERATAIEGVAGKIIMRLTRLAGVTCFETQVDLLEDWREYARRGRDRALFDWCLNQIEELYALHRPQWNIEPSIRIYRADFEATVSGTAERQWPTDLAFLLALWGGEDVAEGKEPLRALGFGEYALRKEERSILREPDYAEGVRQALESALFSPMEDALRVAPQGLSRVGATVRTAQRREALSELRERDAQKVGPTKRPVKIDDSVALDDRPGPSPDPLGSLMDSEALSAWASAIDQLTPAQRRAVLMSVRADSEGKPLRHYYAPKREYKTANDHLQAARTRLATLLKLS